MTTEFLLPAILFLLCLAIRSVYELFKEAGKVDLESKPLFVAIFASMCILWASWFSLCPLDPLPVALPSPLRWLGLALFIIGMVLAVGALIQLRGVENIQHLVTTGLFRKLRHPMYLGFILWIVGWSVYHGAMLSLAIGTAGIANTLWWRHIEDVRLEKQFVSAYRQYRAATWF